MESVSSKVPTGTFTQVSPGYKGVYALSTDGSLVYFGEPPNIEHEVPGSPVRLLPDSYEEGLCAVVQSGALACWGWFQSVRYETVPDNIDGDFTSLGVGAGWACAVTVGGVLTCWGEDTGRHGPLEPPG
jgi:hypothetical protein